MMRMSNEAKGVAMNIDRQNPYAVEVAKDEGTLSAIACALVMAVLCIGMMWVLSRLS